MLKKGFALLLSVITIFSSVPVSASEIVVDTSSFTKQIIDVGTGDLVDEAGTAQALSDNSETVDGNENPEENALMLDESEEDEVEFSEYSDDENDVTASISADISFEDKINEEGTEISFSDGTESDELESVQEISSKDMEELLALASDAENIDAPYSRGDSLGNGTYYDATVNVFVAGEDNTVLGVNAYMTNPKNPVGINDQFGVPTEPVYNNVSEVKIENNTATLTVELKNPVFQLNQIGTASNAEVLGIERGTAATDNSEYGYRITKLKLKLNDLSGLYVFNNSWEYGTPLNDNNPDTDDRWNAPLYVAVDFDELIPGNTYTNPIWRDDTTHVGLTGRGKDLEGVELSVQAVTAGDAYDEYKKIMEENKNTNATGTSTFWLYKVGLTKDGQEFTPNESDRFSLLLDFDSHEASGGTGTDKDIQAYIARDGKLVRMSQETASYTDLTGSWSYPTRFSGMSLGYVVVTKCTYNISCQKTFTDNNLDLSMTYYSDESGDTDTPTWPNAQLLSLSRLVTRDAEEVLTACSSSIMETIANTSNAAGLVGSTGDGYIYSAYGVWLESNVEGTYKATTHTAYHNAQEVVLPVENANEQDYQFYLVTIQDGKCTKVVARKNNGTAVSVVDDKHIKVKIYNYNNTQNESTSAALYAAATGNTSETCTYLTVVRKTKTAEAPVINANLTYNGSEQIGVPEGTGYTLTGATATDAGTYTATATLSKGYVWADGTTDPVTLTWEIARKTAAAKPTAKSGLVYNGSKQSAVAEGEGYNLTGTKEATNAGSYKVNVILSPNYVWPDGTSDNLSLTWTIAKADQKITAKVGSKSYKLADLKKKKASFTIGAKASGKVTYKVQSAPSSKAKSYISVNGSGKVTMKKGAPAGTYKVRVSAASTSNYNAATKDVKITVKKANQKITAKVSSKSYKASSLKKKKATFTIGASAKSKLSYKVTSTPSKKAAKYISVSKTGKVTMKKKAPKGTYKITVTAKATSAYNSATKTIKIVVK